MQTENLANNSHKQFYVLLNTNQIKLHTNPDLLKENSLLGNFPAQNQQPTFQMIPFTTITISASTVIKATEYSMHDLIHNSYEVATKYSIISTETCKVVLPGQSG